MAFDQEQYRPQMHAAMAEISAMIFDAPGFREASFRFREPIGPAENTEIAYRAVELDGVPAWQIVRVDLAENKPHGPAKKKLWELVNSANILAEAHATAADGTALHLRTTKKGHVLLNRVKPQRRTFTLDAALEAAAGADAAACGEDCAAPSHDRVKDYPLARFDSKPLLIALGFMTPGGEMRASMHAKFRQVNEFLRIADDAIDELPARKRRAEAAADGTLSVVDCGCGKSYFSFALKAYFEAVRGVKVKLTGIDRKKHVVDVCRHTAEVLGMDNTDFRACDIADYKPATAPDVVLSLHACDTATDEAIAFGVENGARCILSAPCCQHELQKGLAESKRQRALLRNGILRERLADILTDAFRAQILRVAGYRASVVEFVEPGATARNILIRALRVSHPGTGTAVADYEELRESWDLTPWLAGRLADKLPELQEKPAK